MNSRSRFGGIDTLRGVAIVWMTVYHFCFDLNYLGWIQLRMLEDPVWTTQRTLIVSLFLLCAGLGQSVAVVQGQPWRRFWRRWAQIAGCALLVSVGSYLVFPSSFIYCGVLHGMALMLIVTRSSASWGRWLVPAGAVAIALAWWAPQAHVRWPWMQVLDSPAWNWLGWVGHKPFTEDYVPMLPWLGVIWWGLAAGLWAQSLGAHWLAASIPAVGRPLAWLGRHSLRWYMLHQPVMLGGLMLIKAILV
jgi:uncharacterized membrane protein